MSNVALDTVEDPQMLRTSFRVSWSRKEEIFPFKKSPVSIFPCLSSHFTNFKWCLVYNFDYKCHWIFRCIFNRHVQLTSNFVTHIDRKPK